MIPARHLSLILCLLSPLFLQACAPAVVGGAAVGVSLLHDRRDSARILDDEKTELSIRAAIGEDEELFENSAVGVTSYNGVVLLTGQVQEARLQQRILKIVENQPKAKRVVNETSIGERLSLSADSNDAYITSRVKLALFDLRLEDFDPSRIKVVTEDKTVYLMGLVTADEASQVVEKVRYVRGVKKVVKIFENYQPPAE